MALHIALQSGDALQMCGVDPIACRLGIEVDAAMHLRVAMNKCFNPETGHPTRRNDGVDEADAA